MAGMNARPWPSAGRPLVIGHRGARGYRPENTLVAFELAADQGATWVELDVHLARDRQLVVIHDFLLERTTDGHGFVQAHTLDELKRLDAGAWFGDGYAGARIPTLDEALAWASRRGVGIDIEIKSGPIVYAGIEDAVVAAVHAAGMAEQVLVTSFDHAAVARVRQLDPDLATGVLYSARPVEPWALAERAAAGVVLPQWPHVRAEDVRAVHARGLGYATWATSDPAVLRELVAAGVDGIVTDHPDILLGLLR
jgi:glycerophosphoryl diester phosphodiesterase